MIASLAGSVIVASCLGCSEPPDGGQAIVVSAGPVDGLAALSPENDEPARGQGPALEEPFGLPFGSGSRFSPTRLAGPLVASRLEAIDLATPLPVRGLSGDKWGGEISFAYAAEASGLGVDMSFTPRAQLEINRAGSNVARTGAEFRLGPDLVDRDLRGKSAAAPSWYFFVGADNEALVWNVADATAMDGASLRDQATVGDLQVGVALTTGRNQQMSLGLVERELRFNDLAGNSDIEMREQFAAFSFTLRH
jgi:hypothetical protein